MHLLFLIIIYFKLTHTILITEENRNSTRNITCQHSSLLTAITSIASNCEACLITYRNYPIQTTLSLTGTGPAGVSYACLQVNEVEGYHENLVRECRNFVRSTLYGFDDFCIASPYSYVRGSYRACVCISNGCNFNYSQCLRQQSLYSGRQPIFFQNTVVELKTPVKCYYTYNDYKRQTSSNVTFSCPINDESCKNYVYDHGVLCSISVDRTNSTIRETLIPSIYSSYIIKYKTQLCNSTTWTSNSIFFDNCQQDDIVCMCTVDQCNKDIETCRLARITSSTVSLKYALNLVLCAFILNILFVL